MAIRLAATNYCNGYILGKNKRRLWNTTHYWPYIDGVGSIIPRGTLFERGIKEEDKFVHVPNGAGALMGLLRQYRVWHNWGLWVQCKCGGH